MRPTGAVAVDFGPSDHDSPPRTSDDFEQVPYPTSHWSHREEELPLFSVGEEKARRRVPKSAATPFASDPGRDLYDDEGKDVYNKPRSFKAYHSSGRPPQPPLPPPTSIVSFAT
jgi:dolichyl-phosphate-mannose-protein mannosyltransferase